MFYEPSALRPYVIGDYILNEKRYRQAEAMLEGLNKKLLADPSNKDIKEDIKEIELSLDEYDYDPYN